MRAVTEETCEPERVTAADDFKTDYRAEARDALNRVQQELVTKEIELVTKMRNYRRNWLPSRFRATTGGFKSDS